MADTKKTAVRNIAPGFRGLNTTAGYREFNPNEYAESVEMTTAEFDSAKRTGYFRFGAAAKADPKAEAADQEQPKPVPNPTETTGNGGGGAGGDELDNMSDADLKTTTAALTGKPVEELPDDRDQLLKLARGE